MPRAYSDLPPSRTGGQRTLVLGSTSAATVAELPEGSELPNSTAVSSSRSSKISVSNCLAARYGSRRPVWPTSSARHRSLPCWAREVAGLVELVGHRANLLLLFVPLGALIHHWKLGPALSFLTNFIAIVPVAGIADLATQCLALHTGMAMGGLLLATCGNAVEVIVAVQAIRAGLIHLVQGSLLGSILSNLLLVVGMAFVASGFQRTEADFSSKGVSASTTCLILAGVALCLPTIYEGLPGATQQTVLVISRLTSGVNAAVYSLFLFFQMRTHAHLFTRVTMDEETEDAEQDVLVSPLTAFALFVGSVLVVALSASFLLSSIPEVSRIYGVPEAFIGVILLPIVGNATEHVTAVSAAHQGNMDLALGVAVGSSLQISLFVLPISVMTGWYLEQPMTLNFRSFDATVLILSLFLVSTVLQDGSSNWLEGAMLVATYVIIAIIMWHMPEERAEYMLL